MRVVSIVSYLLLTAASMVARSAAVPFTFINRCPFDVNMWDNYVFTNIAARAGVVTLDVGGLGLMWRHGYDPQATLAEVTVDKGMVWYDISIIPPGTGDCMSYENCHAVAQGRKGFNVAMAMVPKPDRYIGSCRPIFCLYDGCTDAFLYPFDNLKVHSCPDTTPFDIVFCPGGIVDAAVPVPTLPRWSQNTAPAAAPLPAPRAPMAPTAPAPVPAPAMATATVNNRYEPAWFEYRDDQAGSVHGSYSRVTDLATCARERVDVVNPVGPLSEEVTLVFRGPMEIYDIAVYGGAPGAWPRLSRYARGGETNNLIFFNNKNIDYSGRNRWGPQSFASSDGNGAAAAPTPFAGSLAEATNVHAVGGGPGIDTGVEVNIMTAQPCEPGTCRGASSSDFDYRGWGGDRKIFITRVRMPMSGRLPNVPAIWMLNAQVMYTGQYAPCNCRGMGAAGGCGELDIAEVIENQNPRRDRITTHHYFYDGTVRNPPGGNNFASRPTDRTATYVTIMDATVGDGLIKILEIDDSEIDFAASSLSTAQVQRWIDRQG